MNFIQLLSFVENTHKSLQAMTVKAINVNISLRNWIIGYYIVEYEQNGEDRASYGSKLIPSLSQKIKIKGLAETNLKLCRQFYQTYPFLKESIINIHVPYLNYPIRQLLPDEFLTAENQLIEISQSATDEFNGADTVYQTQILQNISFTHFAELIKIEDDIKRKFYELLILKTNPSVAELKRSIYSLTYERLGFSNNYESAFKELSTKILPQKPKDAIKSHYFFEFLEINQADLIEESKLEQALIRHLQNFILELGNGFCFEARQKRITIDDDYYFVDLVFYHRILKCHVLIELKTDKFKHEYLSQLNTYVAYYNDKEIQPDDNPAIGILLCADKGEQMVKYAMAGMNQQLFVSKYQLALPDNNQLLEFIKKELKNIENE